MSGLPREKDATTPQDAWMAFVCGGLERLTFSLRKGDPFSEKALNDMLALDRRLHAFHDALQARIPVVEED